MADFSALISKNSSGSTGGGSGSQQSSDFSSQPAWMQSFLNYNANKGNVFGNLATDNNLDYGSNSQLAQTGSGGTSLAQDDDKTHGYSAWLNDLDENGNLKYKDKPTDLIGGIGQGLMEMSHAIGNAGRIVTEGLNKQAGGGIAGGLVSTAVMPAFPMVGQESLLSSATGNDIKNMNDEGQLPDYKMTGTERAGAGISGTVDTLGVGAGGTGTMLGETAGRYAKHALADDAGKLSTKMEILTGTSGRGVVGTALESKGIKQGTGRYMLAKGLADSIEEGGEEALQSIGEDMRQDQVNEGTLGRAAEAFGMGAAIGGVFSGVGQLAGKGVSASLSGRRLPAPTNQNPAATPGTKSFFANNVLSQRERDEYVPKAVSEAGSQFMKTGNNQPMSHSATVIPDIDNSLDVDQMKEGTENFRAMWDGSNDQEKEAIIDYMFDRSAIEQGGTPAVEAMDALLRDQDMNAVSDQLNNWQDTNQKFYMVHNYKNPQTNEQSHVYMDHMGFFPGEGYRVNAMAASLSNSDADGDMRQFFLEDRLNQFDNVKSGTDSSYIDAGAFWTRGTQPGQEGGYDYNVLSNFDDFKSPEDRKYISGKLYRMMRSVDPNSQYLDNTDIRLLIDALLDNVSTNHNAYYDGSMPWAGESNLRGQAIARVRAHVLERAGVDIAADTAARRVLNRAISQAYQLNSRPDVMMKVMQLQNAVKVNQQHLDEVAKMNPVSTEQDNDGRLYKGDRDRMHTSAITNPELQVASFTPSPSASTKDEAWRDIPNYKYYMIMDSSQYNEVKRQLDPMSSAIVSLAETIGNGKPGLEVINTISNMVSEAIRFDSNLKLKYSSYTSDLHVDQISKEKVDTFCDCLVTGWNLNTEANNEAIKRVAYGEDAERIFGDKVKPMPTLSTEPDQIYMSTAIVLQNSFKQEMIGDWFPGVCFSTSLGGAVITESSTFGDLFDAMSNVERLPQGFMEGAIGTEMRPLLAAMHNRAKSQKTQRADSIADSLESQMRFTEEGHIIDHKAAFTGLYEYVAYIMGARAMIDTGMHNLGGFIDSRLGQMFITGDKSKRKNAVVCTRVLSMYGGFLNMCSDLSLLVESNKSNPIPDFDLRVADIQRRMLEELYKVDDGSPISKLLYHTASDLERITDTNEEALLNFLIDPDMTYERKQEMIENLLNTELSRNTRFDLFEWALDDSVYGDGSTLSDRFVKAQAFDTARINKAIEVEKAHTANLVKNLRDRTWTVDQLKLVCNDCDTMIQADTIIAMCVAPLFIDIHEAEKGQNAAEQVPHASELTMHTFGAEMASITQWQRGISGSINLNELFTNRKVFLEMIFNGRRYAAFDRGHRVSSNSLDGTIGTEEFLRLMLDDYVDNWVDDNGRITNQGLIALLDKAPMFGSFIAPAETRVSYPDNSTHPTSVMARSTTLDDAMSELMQDGAQVFEERRERDRVVATIINNFGWENAFLSTLDVDPDNMSVSEFYKAVRDGWEEYVDDWCFILSDPDSYEEKYEQISKNMTSTSIAKHSKSVAAAINRTRALGIGVGVDGSDLFRTTKLGMLAIPDSLEATLTDLTAKIDAVSQQSEQAKKLINDAIDKAEKSGDPLQNIIAEICKSNGVLGDAFFDVEQSLSDLHAWVDFITKSQQLTSVMIATVGWDAYYTSVNKNSDTLEGRLENVVIKHIRKEMTDQFNKGYLNIDHVMSRCLASTSPAELIVYMNERIDQIYKTNNDTNAVWSAKDLKKRWQEIANKPTDTSEFRRDVYGFVAQVNRLPLDLAAKQFAAVNGAGYNSGMFDDMAEVFKTIDSIKSHWDESGIPAPQYLGKGKNRKSFFKKWNFDNKSMAKVKAHAKNFPITASIQTGIGMNGGFAISMQGIACLPSNRQCGVEPQSVSLSEIYDPKNAEKYVNANYVSKVDGQIHSLSNTADYHQLLAAEGGEIDVFPHDQACTCGMCCKNHSSLSNIARSGDISELTSTLLHIFSTTQEAMMLKRKKLADFSRKVCNTPNDFSDSSDRTLKADGKTIDRDGLLGAFNKYVNAISDTLYSDFKKESADGSLTKRDAWVLANAMCPAVVYRYHGGEVRSIGLDELVNPNSEFNLSSNYAHVDDSGQPLTLDALLNDPDVAIAVMPVSLEELNDKIRYGVADGVRRYPADRTNVARVQSFAADEMLNWDGYIDDTISHDIFVEKAERMKPLGYQTKYGNRIVMGSSDSAYLKWGRDTGAIPKKRTRLPKMPDAAESKYVFDNLDELSHIDSVFGLGDGLYFAGVHREDGATKSTSTLSETLGQYLGKINGDLPVFRPNHKKGTFANLLPSSLSIQNKSVYVIDGSARNIEIWMNNVNNLKELGKVDYIAVPRSRFDDVAPSLDLATSKVVDIDGTEFVLSRSYDFTKEYMDAINVFNEKIDEVGCQLEEFGIYFEDAGKNLGLSDSSEQFTQEFHDSIVQDYTTPFLMRFTDFLPKQIKRGGFGRFNVNALSNDEYDQFQTDMRRNLNEFRQNRSITVADDSTYRLVLPDLSVLKQNGISEATAVSSIENFIDTQQGTFNPRTGAVYGTVRNRDIIGWAQVNRSSYKDGDPIEVMPIFMSTKDVQSFEITGMELAGDSFRFHPLGRTASPNQSKLHPRFTAAKAVASVGGDLFDKIRCKVYDQYVGKRVCYTESSSFVSKLKGRFPFYIVHNLYHAGRLMNTSLALRQNRSGKWVLNNHINPEYASRLRSDNATPEDREFWLAVANGIIQVFKQTAPNSAYLNSAMQKIAMQWLSVYPSVASKNLFESHNFTEDMNGSSFRMNRLEEPGVIFGTLNDDERAAIFHEMNPNICPAPGEKFDYSKHWVDPYTGKIRCVMSDQTGKTTKADLRYGYIGLSSVWRTREGIGQPSSSASLGLQSSTTGALRSGLSASNIGDIVDAIELWANNPQWYANQVCQFESRRLRDSSYMPTADDNYNINKMDILAQTAADAKREYIDNNADNYRGIVWKVKHLGKELKWTGDKSILKREYEQLFREWGFNTIPEARYFAYMFQHQIGWSYNNNMTIKEFKLNDIKSAIRDMRCAFNSQDGSWFIPSANSTPGVFTVPVMPRFIIDHLWECAGDGSVFRAHWNNNYDEYVNSMDAAQQEAYQQYENSISGNVTNLQYHNDKARRNALLNMAEYAYGTHDGRFADRPKRITHNDMTIKEMVSIIDDTMYAFLDEEEQQYIAELSQHNRESLEHYNRMMDYVAEESSVEIEVNDDPAGVRRMSPRPSRYTGASKIMQMIQALIRTAAVLHPTMLLASAAEGGIRGTITKYSIKTGLVGGTEWKNVLDQNMISAIVHDRTNESYWKIVSEFQLLGDFNDMLSIDPTRPIDDQLKELIEANTGADLGGVAGNINKLSNAAMKVMNLEGMFSSRNFEIALMAFAQICAEENIVEMTRLEDHNGQKISRMNWLLINNQAQFFTEVMDRANNEQVYNAWQRAVERSNNTSMTQANVLSIVLDEIFRKYPTLGFLNTTACTAFYRFHTNVFSRTMNAILPISSINHILVDKMNGDPRWQAAGIDRAKIYPSLSAALLSDAIKFGAYGLAMIMVGLSGALQPPDDDERLGADWKEYTFMGIRFRDLPWWAEDMLAMPMIMACWWKSVIDGKPNLALVTNGMSDLMYANPAMSLPDTLEIIFNPDKMTDEWLEESQRWNNRPGGAPEPWTQFASNAAWGGFNLLTGLFIPSGLKALYRSDLRGEYEYSYKQVWDSDAIASGEYLDDAGYDEQSTNMVGYSEAMQRKYALKNPVMALLLDITHPSGTTSYTRGGFFGKAAPVRTQYSDPENRYYANKYNIMEEVANEQNGQTDWVLKDETERMKTVYNVLSILEQYDDMALLRSKGFAINGQTQHYVAVELNKLIQENKSQWEDWAYSDAADYYTLGDGDYTTGKERYYEAKTQWQSYQDYLYGLKDKLYSDEISKGVQKYWRENTTYAKDDYGNWYATGANNRDLLGLDILPKFGDTSEQRTMGREGQWATRSAVNPDQSTGNRVLVPITDFKRIDEDAVNEAVEKEGNKKSSSGSQKTSSKKVMPSYGKRSGGGGGGGGYSSGGKVYSTMPTTRYSNAATINPSRLYGASYDYLRPSFETKGSREAYKREDF